MFQRMIGTSGYDLFYYPTKKFKTTTIRIFFKKTLQENVEEQAVLPFLLKRGSLKYPSLQHISRRLEELYGTALSLDIAKIGEMQVFVVNMDVANPRYLPNNPELLRDCFDMLNDVLLNPVLEDGAFPQHIFEQERINLERLVKSIIDDKTSYTHIRLVSEMYRGEPFGKYEWGDLNRIAALDRCGAYRCYEAIKDTAPIEAYILGCLSPEEEKALPSILLPFEKRGTLIQPLATTNNLFTDGEILVEEQPLEQSKLEMGFRVDVSCKDEDYYALVLYNAILGRGSFSKLFKRVREKESMAYYISSSYDKLKGFLFISAGIDTDNFERVTELIRCCMEEIRMGEISEEELSKAKKALVNGLRSIADTPGQIIEYDFVARTTDRENDIERIIQIISGTTKEQVTRVSKLPYPGKTFFLKGTGNTHGTLNNPE